MATRFVKKDFVDFWRILSDFKSLAPKNLSELKSFEDDCRRECEKAGLPNLVEMVDWIENWRISLEHHVQREYEE